MKTLYTKNGMIGKLWEHISSIFRRSTANAKTPVRFDVIGAGPEWISVCDILL